MPKKSRPVPRYSTQVRQTFSPRSDRILKAAKRRGLMRGTKWRMQGGARGGAPI